MKSILFLSLLTLATIAQATSPMESEERTVESIEFDALEQMTTKSITVSGNLMPGPGRRPSPRIVISLNVHSSGCTKSTDFAVEYVKLGANTTGLVITRTKPDHCRAFLPEGTTVELLLLNSKTYTNKIVVLNPAKVIDQTVH